MHKSGGSLPTLPEWAAQRLPWHSDRQNGLMVDRFASYFLQKYTFLLKQGSFSIEKS